MERKEHDSPASSPGSLASPVPRFGRACDRLHPVTGTRRAAQRPRSESPPEGWREFADDEKVIDVCPECLTAEECTDIVIREAENNVLFDYFDGWDGPTVSKPLAETARNGMNRPVRYNIRL